MHGASLASGRCPRVCDMHTTNSRCWAPGWPTPPQCDRCTAQRGSARSLTRRAPTGGIPLIAASSSPPSWEPLQERRHAHPAAAHEADRRLRSPVRSARAQQEEVVSAARASGADHSTRHRSAAKGVRAHTRTEPRGPRRRASSRTTLCHSVRSLNIRIRSRASAGRKTEAGRSGVRIRGREVRETASAS